MPIKQVFRLWSLLTVLLAAVASGGQTLAAEEFYQGKQVRLLVGTDPGGTFDLYARVLSRHLGKHIPGAPTFVVQNMPGTSSINMANYIYGNAPRDGTVFGASQNTIPTAPLTNPAAAKFDSSKLSWIGSVTDDLYIGYLSSTAPAKSMEEAKAIEVLIGGLSVGAFSIDMAILANEFFGTKFKIVTGYKTSPEIQLAVDRGEVHGVMGTSWNAFKRATPTWLPEGKVRMIVQYGFKRDARFADVPLYIEFAQTDAQRQAIKFMVGNLVHGKPYFAPPEIPADRLLILRRAFDATMKDTDFLKDIEASGVEISNPMRGEELAQFVAEESQTPASILRAIEGIMKKFTEGNR